MTKGILGDTEADSGDEEKSKRAEKYNGTKKSKERREEPLGTMSYQTSSKRSPPFWLLIGARKHNFLATIRSQNWNWSGKTLFPGALLAVLYFSSCHIFFRPFRLFLVPTICRWVSEDGQKASKLNDQKFPLATASKDRSLVHRRKMSTHALQEMTRDRFRVMSLAPRQKCPRNVVVMKEAMAAFFGSDNVAISCHCKR